jgi:hypothetical protein
MHGIAQRIEHCSIPVRDGIMQRPYIFSRHGNVFSKCSVNIHTNDLNILADMAFAGPAKFAVAACYMTFSRYTLTGLKIGYIRSCFFYYSCEFMPPDERGMYPVAGPFVPVIDMNVSSADPGVFDLYEHFTRFWGRFVNLDQVIPLVRVLFYNSFHVHSGIGFNKLDGKNIDI